MRPNATKDKLGLVLREAFSTDPVARAGYAALMRTVFDRQDDGRGAADSPWWPIALFDTAGSCAGSVEFCILDLWLDGSISQATGIRLVGVDSAWRGLGLFRDLMEIAIARCDAAARGPILLYTENEDLYSRFGFEPVVQHAVAGHPPRRGRSIPARHLDTGIDADLALIHRLLATRSPLSTGCALQGPAAIFMDNLLAASDLALAYAADLDALIIYEMEDETIVLVEVVAASMPTMVDLLAALPPCGQVVTLFAPDALGWMGEPRREDAGLMARGGIPDAMRRPFMLPPTAEF